MIEIPRQLQNPEFRFLRLREKDKAPIGEETKWQENNYRFDDKILLTHLENEGNYGVIGGFGKLVLIDADTKEIEEICERMPETFTIKTGSPEEYKKHYFFITDRKMKGIRLTEKKVGDLGDIRSIGQYVVAPNSIHPKGDAYRVLKDLPINKIAVAQIKDYFKDYLGAGGSDDFKEYPIITTKRDDDFIRNCRIPDYIINNKIKGNTSKNWELFPYLVDILHNRGVTQQVYIDLCKRQGHNVGAIKGWVMKAHEGKLMKCNCEKMQNYLFKFHPEIKNEVCKNCILNKTDEENDTIREEVWGLLLERKREDTTELIVNNFLELYNFYTIRNDDNSEMWIYKGGIYIPEGKTFIKERCREILGKAYTTNLLNSVILKIEAETYIDQKEFFEEEDSNLVAVQNGILDLRKKELIPFSSEFRFFNKLPMKYNPESKCENIIKFFNAILKNKDEIKVIQELFGFLLYREYFLEKAIMFLGGGRNGKGKTIDLMKRFLGLENCSEISLEDLENDIYSLGELFKKMANLSGDLSRSALRHTGNFKKLTGRDLVSGARKFKNRVNFENYSKMVFACNELPVTYDITTAFFNRWIIIDFPFTFLTQKEIEKEVDKTNLKLQDPNIIEKIATNEELEGLLIWALEGLGRLFENKGFSLSPSTEETKTHWLRKSDSFQAFIMDCLEEDYDERILKTDLKREYSKYCKSHRLRISNDKVIKALIETILGGWEERLKLDDSQKFYWVGLKLRDNYTDSYGSKGFSTLVKKEENPMTAETLASLTSLTIVEDKPKTPFDKFEKPKPENPQKTQFSPEDIAKSGIDPEMLKSLGVSIPETPKETPPEPVKTPVLEAKPVENTEEQEKALFFKKMVEEGY